MELGTESNFANNSRIMSSFKICTKPKNLATDVTMFKKKDDRNAPHCVHAKLYNSEYSMLSTS